MFRGCGSSFLIPSVIISSQLRVLVESGSGGSSGQ